MGMPVSRFISTSMTVGVEEPDTAAARRVANRARQLQSQLKIGHHAAFRLAEGEAAEGGV